MNLVFPLPIFWSHSLKTIRHSKKQLINANFPYLAILITQITKKNIICCLNFLSSNYELLVSMATKISVIRELYIAASF